MSDNKTLLDGNTKGSLVLVAVGALALGYFGWKVARPQPNVSFEPISIKKADIKPTLKETFPVQINGAVKNPGTYSATEGMRLRDLIEMAGGPTANADMDRVPKVKILKDGSLHVIPERQTQSAKVSRPKASKPILKEPKPITLPVRETVIAQTATVSQFMTLPGISPEQAMGIVKRRGELGHLRSLQDLKGIVGITGHDLNRWEPYLKF